MTTEEKLNNFYDMAIEEASKQSDDMLKEYQVSLDTILDNAKEDMERKSVLTLKNTKETLERDKNKAVSDASIEALKTRNIRTSQLKEDIFNRVMDKINTFKESEAYVELLIKQVNKANLFSKDNDMIIYIDPSDEPIKSRIEQATNVTLTLSNRPFLGGIRAVIQAKNILIDESFTTKLAEKKENYKL